MSTIELEPIKRLTKDLKNATATLSKTEARFMVDYYYQIQEFRKSAKNQKEAMLNSQEPHEVLNWFYGNAEQLENQIKRALGAYAQAFPVGQWSQSITGIGPVISAALLAYIDIEKAPTVGHIWRFAGYDSTQQWLGAAKAKVLVERLKKVGSSHPTLQDIIYVAGTIHCQPEFIQKAVERYAEGKTPTWAHLQKAAALRPWNSRLKTLCWKMGECFVKVSGNASDVYGKVYLTRKLYEQEKNERLEYADQAKAKLENFKIGKDTDAYEFYSIGKLPPAHIHERAKRYTVKLFLAHWHHVAFESRYGKLPPKPYVIEHLGHTDFFAPPNWPMEKK